MKKNLLFTAWNVRLAFILFITIFFITTQKVIYC